MWNAGTKPLLQDKALLENDGNTHTGDEMENKQCPPPLPLNLPFVCGRAQTQGLPVFTSADLFQVSSNHRETW